MTGAIWWKEYREHRAVWVSMAAVGAIGLYGLAFVFAQDMQARRDMREMLCAVAILLSWAYGMIAGAMLLAGEREAGTLTYLDGLPAYRLQIWVRKFLFGVGVMVTQALVLAGLGLALKLVDPAPLPVAAGVGVLLAAGFYGLSWGLLFSSIGRNVLNAIGLAMLGQIVASFLLAFLAFVFAVLLTPFVGRASAEHGVPQILSGGFSGVLLALGPIIASALVFTRPDRTRLPARYARLVGERLGLAAAGRARWVQGQGTVTDAAPARPAPRPAAEVSWRRLLWLALQQFRGLTVGVCLFGLIAGFVVPLVGILLWPTVTLVLGMVCGVAAFRDEQEVGCYRFYGDQRLPLGKVWLVKVSAAFTVGVAACLLMLLPSALWELARSLGDENVGRHVSYIARVMHSGLLGEIVPPFLFLTMWFGYGFAAGHLAGLLFRKTIVAGVVGLLTSTLLVFVWLPSLFGGGLHLWQVWAVPLALMAAARLLLWRWASDRLATRGTFIALGVLGALCVGWDAFGIWWRVAEVPDVPDHLQLATYAASLPKVEDNKAGMHVRGALNRVDGLIRELEADRPMNPGQPFPPPAPGGAPGQAGGMPGVPPGPEPPHVTFRDQLQAVLERGWKEASPEVGVWLDRAFDRDWPEQLAEAAGEPLGLVYDPRNLSLNRPFQHIDAARDCAVLLAARGLQEQSRGHPEEFVKNLRSGLALSRNLRHRALPLSVTFGVIVEEVFTGAVARWLERLEGRPDLLRQALKLLAAHERETPRETADQVKGEYLIALNSLNDVERWLPGALLDEASAERSAGRDFSRLQATLVNYSTLIPWERQRQLLILRAAFEGGPDDIRRVARMGGPLVYAAALVTRRTAGESRRAVAGLRAAQLQVALRLYQADTGKPAQSLAPLVKNDYLDRVPADPFDGDGRPFRYRLSKGEKIEWPEDNPPDLPPGGMPAAGGMGMGPMPPGGAPGMPGAPGPAGGVMPGGPGAAPAPPAAPGGPPMMPGMGGPGGMAAPGGMPGGPAMPPPEEWRPPVKEVPAGQGILWSVGEDGKDDGGLRRPAPNEAVSLAGKDLIYLVPLPPSKQPPPKKPARR